MALHVAALGQVPVDRNARIEDEALTLPAAGFPGRLLEVVENAASQVKHLAEWYEKTGKPVLLADAAGVNFQSKSFYKANNGSWYADTLDALFDNPGCVGFHLCGAYQRNKARRRGLLDEL